MRLRTLQLEAFGPFTREKLDLSGGAPGGLHVIFGPNEAGKSTSLRAVEGLLFGIPERSTDAHVHSLQNLLVGAVLERGEGSAREELHVFRRKRRKDSLVDAEGNPLPDDLLVPWLGGLDIASFQRFGLDQERLTDGALALLGGSEEGLFAAGTAGPEVAKLLQQLQSQEESLYGPRAKRPLNRALSALTEATRMARHAARPPEKWRDQKRAHEAALQRVEELRRERQRLKSEHGRLSNLAEVHSDVARWVSVSGELQRLGDLPELPANAETQRQDAQRALRDAEREMNRLRAELEELEGRLAGLEPPSSLADVEEERWAALQRSVGAELKAWAERPKVEAELSARLDELTRLLGRLGLNPPGAESLVDFVDELRIETSLERRIQRLAARYAQLALADEESARTLDDLTGELAATRAAFEALSDDTELEVAELALARARHVLARTGQRRRALDDVQQLSDRAKRLRDEWGVEGSCDELTQHLPPETAVDEARAEWEALRATERRWLDKRAELLARADDVDARLAAQDLVGEVPSEARLADLRAARDALLGDVEKVAGDPRGLRQWTLELGQRIVDADQVADRLRLEAHRVNERASLLADREATSLALRRVEEQLRETQDRLAALHADWMKRWAKSCGKAVGFADMASARQKLGELIRIESDVSAQARLVDEMTRETQGAIEDLRRSLRLEPGTSRAELEEELSALIEQVAQRVTEARQERERRRTLRTRLEELSSRCESQRSRKTEATQRLEAWRQEWRRALEELRLPLDMPPEEVQAILAERLHLVRMAEDARDKQSRLDAIDRESRQFAAEVRGLVERHAADLADARPLDAAEELIGRMREARRIKHERQRLEQEHLEKRSQLGEAKQAARAADDQLQELLRCARVTEVAELIQVETQVRQARDLMAQRAELEQLLRSHAGADSLSALIAEASGISRYELFARREELEAQLEEIEEALRSADHEARGLEQALELYRSEDAAAAQQRVEAASADARHVLREFLVLRTARVLLSREAARYAERYQGPILARANEHFPRLTLGKYSGLRVGLGDRTLRCVRGGKEVEVKHLSQGTRAQLYLALRLASLEHHFERQPAVPLIFDDLLVDFDDDRACAAFEILGELAARVQILYFTHLGRDLHAARDAVSPDRLFEHRIGVLQPLARLA